MLTDRQTDTHTQTDTTENNTTLSADRADDKMSTVDRREPPDYLSHLDEYAIFDYYIWLLDPDGVGQRRTRV